MLLGFLLTLDLLLLFSHKPGLLGLAADAGGGGGSRESHSSLIAGTLQGDHHPVAPTAAAAIAAAAAAEHHPECSAIDYHTEQQGIDAAAGAAAAAHFKAAEWSQPGAGDHQGHHSPGGEQAGDHDATPSGQGEPRPPAAAAAWKQATPK